MNGPVPKHGLASEIVKAAKAMSLEELWIYTFEVKEITILIQWSFLLWSDTAFNTELDNIHEFNIREMASHDRRVQQFLQQMVLASELKTDLISAKKANSVTLDREHKAKIYKDEMSLRIKALQNLDSSKGSSSERLKEISSIRREQRLSEREQEFHQKMTAQTAALLKKEREWEADLKDKLDFLFEK